MLTFSFDSQADLIGCGIDAERISRFTKFLAEEHPLPFIYSSAEISHARKQHTPARALCASFSCKEALFKALKKPFTFTKCEFFYRPEENPGKVVLCPSEKEFNLIHECAVHTFDGERDELICILHLFGDAVV